MTLKSFHRSLVAIFASVFVMACGPLNADQVYAAETPAPALVMPDLLPAPSLAKTVKLPATPVMLACYNAAGEEVRHGTGFRVAPDLLVTSAHVPVNAAADGSLCSFKLDGASVPFVYVDAVTDTAIVRTPPSDAPIFSLRCEYKPTAGDGVISLGFGRTGGFLATEGKVTEAAIPSTLASVVFQTDSHVEAGMSGGPTLDPFFNVVGINLGARPFSLDRAYSLIVPIGEICGPLERYRHGKSQEANLAGG